jgi:hypothetical protein
MSEAKQYHSRIFFEEKDEAFSQKTKTQKPKSHRVYGDLLAVERFNLKLNLRKQI